MSGNPLFDGWYADPELHYFAGRYYIYPTTSWDLHDQAFFECWCSAPMNLGQTHGGRAIAKVILYRNTIPWRAVFGVVALTMLGAGAGAQLLVALPEPLVAIIVVISFAATFVLERIKQLSLGGVAAPVLAFGAGATSGFSGTSGSLKGAVLRNLGLARLNFVGAASAVSLVGDLTKSAVFLDASLLDYTATMIVLPTLPLMLLASFTGRRLKREIGERAHAALFWSVMIG